MKEYFITSGDDFDVGPNIDELHTIMRAAIPVPGEKWMRTWLMHIADGEDWHAHEHNGYVAVYYVEVGTPAAALWINGVRREPTVGEIIVIPPLTTHYVETNNSGGVRKSYSMQVHHNDEANIMRSPEKVWRNY